MGIFDRLRFHNLENIAKTDPTGNAPQLDPVVNEAANTQQMAVGPFSPGQPLRPYHGVNGAARAWSFPTAYNVKTGVNRDGRISFDKLKELIDNYSVARACIQHRIDDVRSLEYSIQPRDDANGDVDDAIDAAYRAMRKPDGVHSFRSWLAMFLEDVLRYDAGCLVKQRDRLGRYCGLRVISGITMAPKLDEYGDRPSGNATAFQQYNDGLPWMDFTADQVIYEPFRPQPDSPYGIAPIEAVLITANTNMRYQQYWMQWFTEGTMPAGFATLPESLDTPEQIGAFQEAYDAAHTGDGAFKSQLEFIPAGTKFEWPKDTVFSSEFVLFLMHEVCSAYGVTPNDLGWTDDVNRSTGDTQVDVQFRIGTLPMVQYVQDILNGYLQDDLGLPVKFQFDTGQESEDRLATAQSWKIGVEAGAVSADEMRQDLYGKQIDNDQPIPRGLISTRLGFTPWASILSGAGPLDPETMAPAEGAPLPDVSLSAVNTSPPTPHPIPNSATPAVKGDKNPQAQLAAVDAGQAPVVVKNGVDLDEIANRELNQFQAFVKSRLKTGHWRDFKFSAIAPVDAAELNNAARAIVTKDSASDADPKEPAVGTSKWRQQNADPTPQQNIDLPLTDHYSPKVLDGMHTLWSQADLAAAQSATDGLGDVAIGVYQKTVRQVLAGNVNSQNLEATVKSLWADAYTAGAMSARAQVAGIPVNWDNWKPGLESRLTQTLPGLQAALADANITIKGITETTMDRIGSAIVDGVNNGDPSHVTAKAINAVLGDPKRAELIAHTETARMLNMAAMSTYDDLNATQFDLIISEGACDELCVPAAMDNPHNINDAEAQVPLHPRCRCSTTPHVDDATRAAAASGLSNLDMGDTLEAGELDESELAPGPDDETEMPTPDAPATDDNLADEPADYGEFIGDLAPVAEATMDMSDVAAAADGTATLEDAAADYAPQAVASVADQLTEETTASWSDDDLNGAIGMLADDPAAQSKIRDMIDLRTAQAEAQADMDAAAEISGFTDNIAPSTNPLINGTLNTARRLSPAEAANEEYDTYVYGQYARALEDTNGNFYNNKLHAEALAKGYDEMTLFQGSYRNVAKYASDELKTWWEDNGRETQGSFRYKLLGRPADKRFADVVQRLGFGRGKGGLGKDRSTF